jgi:hypothetical protein
MLKYVRDTKAGKSIKAYVIMKGRRKVAKVQVHYGDSGTVLVNVWQDSDGFARSAEQANWHEDQENFQFASAGGYGYDKFINALAGMWIDGHQMADHCGARKKLPKGQNVFPVGFTAPKGYRLANWISGDQPGWRDCYKLPGLDYLRDLGYIVVQAI